MWKYIINFEDGTLYVANTITEADRNASAAGIIAIIRVEDGHIHMGEDKWSPLPEWSSIEEEQDDDED